MDVVEGFTCVNDVSNRHDQQEDRNWVQAFGSSLPIGAVLGDPHAQHIAQAASVSPIINHRKITHRHYYLVKPTSRYGTYAEGYVQK